MEMIVVIDRRRAAKMTMLVVFLAAAGFLWATSGHERELWSAQGVEPLWTALPGEEAHEPAQPVTAAVAVEVMPAEEGLFAEYRLERDRARAAQMELIRSALDAPGLDEARRSQLSAELLALLRKGERELQAETLLRAKGFSEAVVVLTDTGANAVIADVLQQGEVAKVGELVARATGVQLERIVIIDGATRS
jgi:hypothetical protein